MDPQIHIEGFNVRALQDADKPILQAAFDLDREYFLDINGRDIPVSEICDYVPDGRSRDDKFTYVIERQDCIAGMIDVVRDYPEAGVWYLGFLYIIQEFRGGLGRRALQALYPWAKARGGAALRLGVVEPNIRARHLYATEGFVFEATREVDPSINRMRRTLVLRRPL